MSKGFYLLDKDGMPEAFIDTARFAAEERRIASLLAVSSRDGDAVTAIIARELQDQGTPEQVRTLLALGVLYQLTTGVLGPHMTLAEIDHPHNDFAGDLLALVNQELLQGGDDTLGGSPPEGK